nr:DUF3365 domain-containing protein [Nitrospirota bacterium]
MTSKQLRAGIAVLAAALSVATAWAAEPASSAGVKIAPETVADYVHAVIEADRIFYTLHVVERMQAKGLVTASENWRVSHTLPLPAQFLKESGELAAITGAKIQYRLIGLWPINPQNAASTDFEKKGLEEVRTHPERPYTGVTTLGGNKYFQAIYADRAFSQACIGCHNAHPRSAKQDFKINDVLGGVLISFPLE